MLGVATHEREERRAGIAPGNDRLRRAAEDRRHASAQLVERPFSRVGDDGSGLRLGLPPHEMGLLEQGEAAPEVHGTLVQVPRGWGKRARARSRYPRRAVTIRIFGLTGGIGSGKSTVAERFRERGLPVIDADVLAREVVAKGTPGLAAIVEAFGAAVLDEHGELARKRLADLVFHDEPARQRLNAITHPRVRELALERAQELDARGEPLACYEVPLLIETGMAELLRPLVVVAVDPETQLRRTVSRDGASEEHVKARIAAQMPLEDKAKIADYVIDNTGSAAETRARADAVLAAICAEFGVDPARYAG